MTRGSVPNFLSNSQENFRKFGKNILGALNEVKQDAQAPRKIISDISKNISVNMKRAPWGAYVSDIGRTSKSPTGGIRDYETPVADTTKTSRNLSKRVADFLTGEDQRKYGYGFNPYKMQSEVASNVAGVVENIGQKQALNVGGKRIDIPGTGPINLPSNIAEDGSPQFDPDGRGGDGGFGPLDSTGLSAAGAAALAFGIPRLYNTLSGKSGSITEGLRPKGYKAVAPVSKEEDPTGKKSRSLVEEAGLRYFAGQQSQMLPFKEFIKERPDVMPSTIKEYRRYMNRKPEAGKRIDIDPEKQTFTAFGGAIKGTARGLNDPEIRFKGVPFTASATLGTAAGVATVAAGVKQLNPYTKGINAMEKRLNMEKVELQEEIRRGGAGTERVQESLKRKVDTTQDMIDTAKKIRYEEMLSPAAQKFDKLGSLKEPAILLGGTLAAVGTAAVAKKLFQKAEQERIKKEDPLQYKKYKRGDYTRED